MQSGSTIRCEHEKESRNPMLTSIDIKNFRCFKHLEIGGLKRFNFIVGDGGSGKTALLESFFLAGGGSPEIYFRLRSWRGFGEYRLQGSRESFESLFRDLFFEFDHTSGVIIRLKDSQVGDRTLRIYYGQDEAISLPLRGKPNPDTSTTSIQPLHFKWQSQSKTVDSKAYIEDGVLKLSGTQDVYPMHLISPLTISPTFSAQRFSELSKANKHRKVEALVRELFPMVCDITTEAIGGDVMLYASVQGLKEKLPVAVLSGGDLPRLFQPVITEDFKIAANSFGVR